jgi:hypothetical protein
MGLAQGVTRRITTIFLGSESVDEYLDRMVSAPVDTLAHSMNGILRLIAHIVLW